jgi:hypothetical protein
VTELYCLCVFPFTSLGKKSRDTVSWTKQEQVQLSQCSSSQYSGGKPLRKSTHLSDEKKQGLSPEPHQLRQEARVLNWDQFLELE